MPKAVYYSGCRKAELSMVGFKRVVSHHIQACCHLTTTVTCEDDEWCKVASKIWLQASSYLFVSDIAIFVLKRDVKLQLTNSSYLFCGLAAENCSGDSKFKIGFGASGQLLECIVAVDRYWLQLWNQTLVDVCRLFYSGKWEIARHRNRAATTSIDHRISGLSYPRDTRALPARQHIYPRLQSEKWCHNAAWATQRCR